MDDNNIPPLPPRSPSGWPAWEPRRVDGWWARLSTPAKVGVVIGSVVAGAAISAGVKASSGNSTSTAPAACVSNWNRTNATKQGVGRFVFNFQNPAPGAYGNATVGYSADFPDKCMVTVGNSSAMEAEQFVQDASYQWDAHPTWTGVVSQLPSGILPWNAKIANDGTLSLG
jgi:hypothetical protein